MRNEKKATASRAALEIGTGIVLKESFAGALAPGRVVGTLTAGGAERKGIDLEGVISADNGALRIQPLLTPGWGRAGLAYGPYSRANGLAFAAFLLNGHNTSQSENLRESFRSRLERWLAGANMYRRRERIVQWLKSTRKIRTLRQWRWWYRISKEAKPVERIDENLAVGWFASEQSIARGNMFLMHATGAENGELWARVGDSYLAAVRGVQNLQIYYVVVLRERGAAYYSSSVPSAHGLGEYPALRPLAIDPFNDDRELHAGLQQAVLGQIGFRADTRVYGACVAAVPEWSTWFGTAHGADSLRGQGPIAGSEAEIGGRWYAPAGGFERTSAGLRAVADNSTAILRPPTPTGLAHVVIHCGSRGGSMSLFWRFLNAENFWRVTLSGDCCTLARSTDGECVDLARSSLTNLRSNFSHSLQILDDGRQIGLHLDGELLFGGRFEDPALNSATGVGLGISCSDGDIILENFEAHPRSCALPSVLDMGPPWLRLGHQVVVGEDFEGQARDLDGKQSTTGGSTWQRTIGVGEIRVTGAGSGKVKASTREPNPGRTVYTIEWLSPDFADLEMEITPPGTAKGQREHGSSGFVFWQDARNYVVTNIWRNDSYDGASISTFFHLDGFEDLYDAIWTNVGNRVFWGQPHRLRAVFDGLRITALVNDEPVVYRALTDVYPEASTLVIRRVGLLANWEWGDDTGCVFRHFRART